MNNDFHTPVLADTAVQYLLTVPDGIYVDGTLGGGGHAELLLVNASARATLIGFDVDPSGLTFAQARLMRFGDRVRTLHDNFANLRSRLLDLNLEGINGLLLDLGMSSRHIDDSTRGFSFQVESRLDMRMDPRQSLDAQSVVGTFSQEQLADLFWKYGEERNSRSIARKIVGERQRKPINTTTELAGIVESAVGRKYLRQTLARVFQAIRIVVNNELENLETALHDVIDFLVPGGRIVVISYHSLEDRIVKEFFRKEALRSVSSGNKLIPDRQVDPRLKVLTKKPIEADLQEIERNPRARSAKLRAAERI